MHIVIRCDDMQNTRSIGDLRTNSQQWKQPMTVYKQINQLKKKKTKRNRSNIRTHFKTKQIIKNVKQTYHLEIGTSSANLENWMNFPKKKEQIIQCFTPTSDSASVRLIESAYIDITAHSTPYVCASPLFSIRFGAKCRCVFDFYDAIQFQTK